MNHGPEINADCTRLVIVRPEEMIWEDMGLEGASQVVLERVNNKGLGRETILLRLAPDTNLSAEVLKERIEIFVVEGTFSDGHGEYGPQTFIMNPAGLNYRAASESGCLLYVKRLRGFSGGSERIVTNLKAAPWAPFGERVAEVVPFYKEPDRDVTARVGRVFPEAQILEHDHPGGEEVLILDGVFSDQFGDGKPGTWLRYPIGLAHAPYSGPEGALIYIRDGDVSW